MSDYLMHDLDRYGVVVRDRSEIVALHGADGFLDAVTLTTGEQLPTSFLFLFLGASPCTDWLDHTVARDADGFVLTGSAAAAENLLETNIPGVLAAGDVRSGSTKRCPRRSAKVRWRCNSSTLGSQQADCWRDDQHRASDGDLKPAGHAPNASKPPSSQ